MQYCCLVLQVDNFLIVFRYQIVPWLLFFYQKTSSFGILDYVFNGSHTKKSVEIESLLVPLLEVFALPDIVERATRNPRWCNYILHPLAAQRIHPQKDRHIFIPNMGDVYKNISWASQLLSPDNICEIAKFQAVKN